MQICPVLDVGDGEAGAVEGAAADDGDVAAAEDCVAGFVAVAEGWTPVVDAEVVVA